MNKMKRFIVTALIVACLFVPMLTLNASAKTASLSEDGKITEYLYSPWDFMQVGINNAKKDAKYTVSFSKKGVLQLEGYFTDAKMKYTNLNFWKVATGTVTVTVKETYKGKTKKIGSFECVIKKTKDYYSNSDMKSMGSYLKKKVQKNYDGVSLEVAKMLNVSNTGATFVLDHKVSALEKAASKGGKIQFCIFDGANRSAYYEGYLQTGSKIVNAGRKRLIYGTNITLTPGKTYYAATFKRSTKGGNGLLLKAVAK